MTVRTKELYPGVPYFLLGQDVYKRQVLCWPIAQFLPDMAQYGLLIYIYVLMSCLRTLCTCLLYTSRCV